ncbi:hypothetical protein [Bauldia litoralis]|uniref:Yip1 domain-containing protein n=1 Tax=Bauldia litoralis TaxID=665467 RepID=A0A1G6E5V5_9HYPH|nr:hypothetical protein [Bauldia litoralis]SDB52783.1 hypothetical protein SAMN02982931_04159 [Bauldia litoralis]
MLDRDEIRRSLTGAWDLFLDRPEAMRAFDVSVEGFWRSFRVIVLLLPAYFLTTMAEQIMLSETAVETAGPGGVALFLDSVVGLGLDWIALPVVLALAARPLGIQRNYAAFIVARNWGAVIALTPFGVIGLLVILGLLNAEIANFLMLASLMVVLRYNFLIARRALDVGIGFAIGIVILDLAVSLTIALALDSVFGL